MNSQFYPVFPNQAYSLHSVSQYQLMIQQAEQQILMGLQAQHASTGYPIDWLQGGAHVSAVLAAIGGGTVSADGNGMYGGLQVLLRYTWAMGAVHGFQQGYNAQQWYGIQN